MIGASFGLEGSCHAPHRLCAEEPSATDAAFV